MKQISIYIYEFMHNVLGKKKIQVHQVPDSTNEFLKILRLMQLNTSEITSNILFCFPGQVCLETI